jgi:5-methylcytosine-specific restriction endonuclease McrA
MDNYIKDWFHVVKNCSVDNTYKMGWGKSIIECCIETPNEQNIPFDRISLKMFKYYWNQTIFFDLQQSPNPIKPPELYTYVKEIISEYQSKYGFKPILFDKVDDRLSVDINKINKIVKKDVCHRFLKVGGEVFDLYELDRSSLTIKVHNPSILKEYSDFFFEMINYRWTQILENFNSSPRISKKVRIIDLTEIKRTSLQKFHKYLNKLDMNCSICGEPIIDNPSIDHVIPWSYMYSDDLWNLVYTHKGCNSSKSNRIVGEFEIIQLENRNKELVQLLNNLEIQDKHTEELELSIRKDYVRKFWIGFKG